MTNPPNPVFICSHMDEAGPYYPSAVEAEGEHGGNAIEYVQLPGESVLALFLYNLYRERSKMRPVNTMGANRTPEAEHCREQACSIIALLRGQG